jgi:hypothetical protein
MEPEVGDVYEPVAVGDLEAPLSTPVMRRTIVGRTGMMIVGSRRAGDVDDPDRRRRRHRHDADFFHRSAVLAVNHHATTEPEHRKNNGNSQRDLLHNPFSRTSDILRMSCP